MSAYSRIVIVGLAAAAAAFFLGYAIGPRTGETPATAVTLSAVDILAGSAITPVSIVSLIQDASSSPSLHIEYPQFPSLSASLNDAIASATLSRLAEFKQESSQNEAARQAAARDDTAIAPSDYSFIASWEPVQINSRYVSFVERYDSYTGGANEDQEIQTFNYDIAAHRMMALGDLFPEATGYLNEIAILARTQLADSMDEASDGNVPTDMLDAGTQPTAADLADFTFTDYAVTVYFPKYAVAPGSFGEQHAEIPRSEVK